MLVIGLLLFFTMAPIQLVRERQWRKEHPGEPLSRELRWGRYIFGSMAAVIVIAALVVGDGGS